MCIPGVSWKQRHRPLSSCRCVFNFCSFLRPLKLCFGTHYKWRKHRERTWPSPISTFFSLKTQSRWPGFLLYLRSDSLCIPVISLVKARCAPFGDSANNLSTRKKTVQLNKTCIPGRRALQRRLGELGYFLPLMGQITDFSMFNASLSLSSFQMIVSFNNNQFRAKDRRRKLFEVTQKRKMRDHFFFFFFVKRLEPKKFDAHLALTTTISSVLWTSSLAGLFLVIAIPSQSPQEWYEDYDEALPFTTSWSLPLRRNLFSWSVIYLLANGCLFLL